MFKNQNNINIITSAATDKFITDNFASTSKTHTNIAHNISEITFDVLKYERYKCVLDRINSELLHTDLSLEIFNPETRKNKSI